MSENNGRPRVQLVNMARHQPPIHIDCSGWKRKPGMWSRGQLVNMARHLPTIEVRMFPAVWLELVVSFDAGTPPGKVIEHTNRLIYAAAEAVPDLGLTYDIGRSRAEGENVVVALRPRLLAADTRDRLAAVAEVIRQAVAKVDRHAVPSAVTTAGRENGIAVRVAGLAA